MNQPSLDTLMKKVDNRYTLVVVAAKRARLLTGTEKNNISSNGRKPVTRALHDIAGDKIEYKHTRQGRK